MSLYLTDKSNVGSDNNLVPSGNVEILAKTSLKFVIKYRKISNIRRILADNKFV